MRKNLLYAIIIVMFFVALITASKGVSDFNKNKTPIDTNQIPDINNTDNLTEENSNIDSKPTEKPVELKTNKIPELGLSFQAPSDFTFNYEAFKAEGTDKIYNIVLYVEKPNVTEESYYQLYGMFNLESIVEEKVLDELKDQLEPNSIEEKTVDSYKALSGQFKGQRNRFITYILKDKKLYTLATSNATEENKQLSDTIISTFKFE